jgi:rifampicin phosphotransferase
MAADPRAAGELTRSLDALGQADLPRAGGKGASLGAMLQAGLPVPEGVAVLSGTWWG